MLTCLNKDYIRKKIRNGLKSIWWKPELVEGAIFDDVDIPLCPTISSELPDKIITFEEAKILYRKEIINNPNFKSNYFVCFYIDDYKFDTFRGIWFSPKRALKILKHFKGIITPDFSTYVDFPYPLKIWNTYRMRAFGYWCGKQGLEVINNVRGSILDFDYCFRGIPSNSIVAIGTVGSGLKLLENREHFKMWLDEMIKSLHPKIIITYGSANYDVFQRAKDLGVEIYSFESKTSQVFKRRKQHE